MALAFVQGTTTLDSVNGSTIVATLPGSIVSGNLLVYLVTTDGNPTVTQTGGGLTKQFEVVASAGKSTCAVFTKIAGGSEPATITFDLPDQPQTAAAFIMELSGNHATDFWNIHAVDTTQSGDTLTHPSVTTTVADTLVFNVHGQDEGDSPVTESETQRVDDQTDPALDPAVSIFAQSFVQAAAGATGTRDVTGCDTTNAAVATFAIAPVTITVDMWQREAVFPTPLTREVVSY